ncbi:MAG: hypothetical protein QM730_27470 [Anaerolineales bacterium]
MSALGIIVRMIYRILRFVDLFVVIAILLLVSKSDTPRFASDTDRTRAFTRQIEFDYPNWVWNAAWIKIEQGVIGVPYSFDRGTSKQIVFDYLHVTQQLMQIDLRTEQIFADPSITDKDSATAFLRKQREKLSAQQTQIAPFAKSILQSQLSEALAELGLTTAGQPIPQVLYHITPTPRALIVSPRNKIVQIANISILPTLPR